MADTSFRLQLRVGGRVWDVTDQTPPGYGLVGSVTKRTELPDGQPWPTQPDPAVSTFQLVAAHASELAGESHVNGGVVLGQRVVWRYWTPRERLQNQPTETFYGVVTDVDVEPHDLGVVFTVTATEATTMLAEVQVGGGTDWPQETSTARLDRIITEAFWASNQEVPTRLNYVPVGGVSTPPENPIRVARPRGAGSALELIHELLASWANYYYPAGVPYAIGRFILSAEWGARPGITNADVTLDYVLSGWRLTPTFNKVGNNTKLPGKLGPTDRGGYGVTVPMDPAPTGRDGRIRAGLVDRASKWSQRRGQLANTATVSGKWGTGGGDASYTATTGERPVVSWQLSTDLAYSGDAQRVANMVLPEVSNRSEAWVADDFTWQLWADQAAADRFLPQLGDLVTVAPIDASWNPTARDYYAGMLAGYTFSLADGRPLVAFKLRPFGRGLLADPAQSLTVDGLPAGVTYNQLNADTWDDYRLLGS